MAVAIWRDQRTIYHVQVCDMGRNSSWCACRVGALSNDNPNDNRTITKNYKFFSHPTISHLKNIRAYCLEIIPRPPPNRTRSAPQLFDRTFPDSGRRRLVDDWREEPKGSVSATYGTNPEEDDWPPGLLHVKTFQQRMERTQRI